MCSSTPLFRFEGKERKMDIPNQLKREDIKLVLLEKSGKKPYQKDWNNRLITYNSEEFMFHITNGGNYGVMGGNHLVVVDFDNDKVQEEALKKLPKTFTVKTGSGKLHLYYRVEEENPKSFKGFDEELNTLFDVQGVGKQVVGPGSVHPNGNKYEVIEDMDIQTISYAELQAILMPFDRKPKKENKIEISTKDSTYTDSFVDDVKRKFKMEKALRYLGVDTAKNPTQCPFHSSKGGKCLGFNDETAHCFHCDGSWNVFSLIMKEKNLSFKESLELIADMVGMKDELLESRKKYIEQQQAQITDEYQKIKFRYLELISGKEKLWGPASELLVEFIRKKLKFYTTKDDVKSEMWVYRDGIYVPQGRSEIKEILRTILGDSYSSYVINLVIAKIEADTFIDQDKFFNNNYVNEVPVLNGILNILTRKIEPFTPDKIFFNKLPVAYNPNVDCPLIDKFVTDVLASKDDRFVFYELGGFCLLKDYKFEKAFMFVGAGRNGKDKSLELIKRLLGVENCCSVPLASIVPDSFIISEFHNKMANLAGEISNQDLKDASAFKSLTGRSLQSAPRKFLKPVTFVNHAKFIFACNELPMVYENNKGFWDRWVLLEFPYTFVTQQELDSQKDKSAFKLRDESIIEKITTPDEMSGLLNKFLDGLQRLLNNKGFSSTKGSDEIKQLWIRKSNSVMAFCMEYIKEEYDSFISKKNFRKKYSEFCKTHKVTPRSDHVIKRTLEDLFGSSEANRDNAFGVWERVWEGIKWAK